MVTAYHASHPEDFNQKRVNTDEDIPAEHQRKSVHRLSQEISRQTTPGVISMTGTRVRLSSKLAPAVFISKDRRTVKPSTKQSNPTLSSQGPHNPLNGSVMSSQKSPMNNHEETFGETEQRQSMENREHVDASLSKLSMLQSQSLHKGLVNSNQNSADLAEYIERPTIISTKKVIQ